METRSAGRQKNRRAIETFHISAPLILSTPSWQPAPAAPRAGEPADTLGIIQLSDVKPEPVEWLWTSRIAAGKLTLFAGDPGLGKSQITIDIAARITTGSSWPDDGQAPVGN